MRTEQVKSLVADLLQYASDACETAKTASRNRKSLAGDNFYGNRFHEHLVSISAIETKLWRFLGESDGVDIDDLSRSIRVVKSVDAHPKERAAALKSLRMTCETQIVSLLESMTADPVPATEQVLPMAVMTGTRGYIEKVVLQANGTYEHQWYDACSVMIRRLVETLIIEVYEAEGRPNHIKGNDGNFLMLSGLIDKIMSDASLNLGRETKRGLPLVKTLGDRAAHNRHYLAKKQDIDKVIHDLRVIADELLHKSQLK